MGGVFQLALQHPLGLGREKLQQQRQAQLASQAAVQPLYGRLHGGVGQVVAGTVGQTVEPLAFLLGFASAVVGGPVLRVFQHGGLQRRAEPSAAATQRGVYLFQPAQGALLEIAEGRAHLEDAHPALHHGAQGAAGLVIGGVALVDEAGQLPQRLGQGAGGLRLEDLHLLAGELRPRLHHQGNHPLIGTAHPGLFHLPAEAFRRFLGGGGGGELQALLLLGAARHRHLAAYDIHRAVAALPRRFLGGGQQGRPPAGDGLVGQGRGGVIAAKAHAGVYVDFLKARPRIAAHQLGGLFHCGALGLAAPDQWAQMVAPQQLLFPGKARSIGYLLHKTQEIHRLHAGVAAKLVHLVGGGFHQSRGTLLPGQAQHRLNGRGTGRAGRAKPLVARGKQGGKMWIPHGFVPFQPQASRRATGGRWSHPAPPGSPRRRYRGCLWGRRWQAIFPATEAAEAAGCAGRPPALQRARR